MAIFGLYFMALNLLANLAQDIVGTVSEPDVHFCHAELVATV
jgi:hypothetical protein